MASDLRLKIVAGEGAGRELAIPEIGAVLGRDKEADIVLGETVLSRRHCRIFRLERRWLVEDLGSRNGTFVNGSRTTRAELKAGDTIQLGHIRLTLLAPAVAPTSAEPSPPAAPSSVRKRRLPLIAGAAAAVVALGVIAYTVHALSLSSRAAELRQQLIALRKQAKAELGDGRYESAVKTYEQLLTRAAPETLADAEVRAIVEESRESVEIARRAIESRRKVPQPPIDEPGQTKVDQGLAKEVEEQLAGPTRKRPPGKTSERGGKARVEPQTTVDQHKEPSPPQGEVEVAAWQRSWPAFAKAVDQIAWKGNGNLYDLALAFADKEVEWSGTVTSIERPGPAQVRPRITLHMAVPVTVWIPCVTLHEGVLVRIPPHAVAVYSLHIKPSTHEWGGWTKVVAGDWVRFRTTLVKGTLPGEGIVGALPNGKTVTAWINTKDGRLISQEPGIAQPAP